MNNDLKQFSEERLKELASTPEKYDHRYTCNMLNGDESRALARIALAAKQGRPTFEDWLSSRTDTIEVDCGCVTTEAFYHWLKVAYEATPQPAHTEQDGWINCSERMPEVGDVVITAYQGAINIGEMERSKNDFGYFTSIVSGRELPADFWMPLPAAPKPESE